MEEPRKPKSRKLTFFRKIKIPSNIKKNQNKMAIIYNN